MGGTWTFSGRSLGGAGEVGPGRGGGVGREGGAGREAAAANRAGGTANSRQCSATLISRFIVNCSHIRLPQNGLLRRYGMLA